MELALNRVVFTKTQQSSLLSLKSKGKWQRGDFTCEELQSIIIERKASFSPRPGNGENVLRKGSVANGEPNVDSLLKLKYA